MLKFTLYFGALLCAVSVHTVHAVQSPFTKCGDQPHPQRLSFNNCKTSQQFCQVERGANVLSRMQFATTQSVNNLRGEAFSYINGQWIQWPLSARTNACDFLMNNAACPLYPNTAYTYELRAKFPTQVPLNQPFYVYFTVRDTDRKQPLSCFRTRVNVAK